MAVETIVHRALGDPSRQRLLELLRAEGGPLAIDELADRSSLHPNTVRGHLAVLEEAELVASSRERRERPGRPRRLFHAVGSPRREHELLAEALAATLSEVPDGPQRAYASGRSWGRYLVERAPPGRARDEAASIEGVRRLLAERGFAPTVEGRTISMHSCPFAELAARHTNVVCALHRGLLDGALEELDAGVCVERLTPWAEPGICRAVLDERVAAGG
jgi:predicted ArsR family transcriptional regulator